MQAADRGTLGRFVREHHLHYEVEPEETVAPDHREVTGYQVRLFATHGEAKLEEPACPRCVELTSELREFARELVEPAGGGDRAEVVPPRATPKIYKSTEVDGADEVSVTVRVLCATPEHRGQGGPAERCIEPLRGKLEKLGVPRR